MFRSSLLQMQVFKAIFVLIVTPFGRSWSYAPFKSREAVLKDLLLDKCNLNDVARPTLNFSQPINVKMSLYASSFSGIDDVRQTMSLLGELFISWSHPCAFWNDTDQFSDVDYIQLDVSNIWVPHLLHKNAVHDVSLRTIGRFEPVYAYFNGVMQWWIGAKFTSTCDLE